jgi:hypothetical protein
MTKTYCDRCGECIGAEVDKEMIIVSVTCYDENGDVFVRTGMSGDSDLCRPCADIVRKALAPIVGIPKEEVPAGAPPA